MAGGNQPEVLKRWKELASQEPSQQRRREFAGLALVFAELAKELPSWQQSLEGWKVEESQVVLQWQAQAREQGLQQGFRDALLLLLQERFPAPLPADLLERIQKETGSGEIRRWLALAAKASSLEQFQAALGG